MKAVEFYPLFILLLLVLPILSKLIVTGNLIGFCSKYYDKGGRMLSFGTPQAVAHTLLGICAGFLVSPKKFTDNKISYWVRNALIVVFVLSYPGYDLIKRGNKHYDYFGESSYYMNMTDFIIGFVLGYLSGLIIDIIFKFRDNDNDKEPEIKPSFDIDHRVLIGLFVVLTLLSITTISLSLQVDKRHPSCVKQKAK